MIWFRPEVIQLVDWAGDPAKAVLKTDDGCVSPRVNRLRSGEVVQSTSLFELSVLPPAPFVVKRKISWFRPKRAAKRTNFKMNKDMMEFSPVALR